jgi:DNA polymerase III epsilon subunit family exonuclease
MELVRQESFDDLGTPLSQVTFVVVDVETTGGSPASSSLTEVAAARYRGGELLATFQTFVRPDQRIPPFITALTGISDAMVADASRVGEMLPSFLEFVGGAVLVGHNLRFDLSFLNHALISTGRDPLDNASVDTLALARRLVRDMVANCKLGTLAAGLGLDHQPSHRALTDVLATGDLLHAMLERAGSFGILDLEELLALPRLVGHPQGNKLRLTTRLPRKPGVYWFADAAGNFLYVGKATDLHSRVRSYFTGDKRRMVGRLLRQMDAVHHRVCPGQLTAAVLEGRLIRAWSPPYNKQGKVRRAVSTGAAPTGAAPTGALPGRSRRRARRWRASDLEAPPLELLGPLAARLVELASGQRFEEAAAVRDEAERLRHLLVRHRGVECLRRSGRLVLEVAGEGTIELDGGLIVGRGGLFDDAVGAEGAVSGVGRAADTIVGDGHDNERIIVALWLRANADRVRITEADPGGGLLMPADRIPTLAELCARPGQRGTPADASVTHSQPVGVGGPGQSS